MKRINRELRYTTFKHPSSPRTKTSEEEKRFRENNKKLERKIRLVLDNINHISNNKEQYKSNRG